MNSAVEVSMPVVFLFPNRKQISDRSATGRRFAGRWGKAAGSGGNTVGSDGAGRDEFAHIGTRAGRADRRFCVRCKGELLELVAAGIALVLEDRHGGDSLVFWVLQ